MGSEPVTASKMPSRRRRLLWTVATIVVLAFVIYGVAAVSSPKKPTDSGASSAAETKADPTGDEAASRRLYAQATEAQRSGDTSRALDLARQAAEANPDNTQATRLVVTLETQSESENPSGGTGSTQPGGASTGGAATATSSAVATSAPAQPRVKNIATLLPAKLAGYTFGTEQALAKDAVVTAEPLATSADYKSVTRVLYSIHDRGSAGAAKKWVDSVNKRLYSKSRTAVTVASGPGVFGTNGSTLATAAFARGPYAFEAVVVVKNGNPASAKLTAVRLADAFPVKH